MSVCKWTQAKQERGSSALIGYWWWGRLGNMGAPRPPKTGSAFPEDLSSGPSLGVGPSYLALTAELHSADQPTCCHSLATRPSPLGPWRHDACLPSAPTHTPLVLSHRGRESGEQQTKQQTSFPRDWCQGCALPGRLPGSPAWHPVEPVPGVRGQAFWGESVCPVLPWRQLSLEALAELPEGSSWARAGVGDS